MNAITWIAIVLAALLLVGALSAVRIVREYQRVVVFRLGRLRTARGLACRSSASRPRTSASPTP